MKQLVFALAVLLGTATASYASPIYSCPAGSSECMGQTFAQWIAGSGTGYFDIATSIDTTGYTGPAGSLAFGIEIKNLIAPNAVYTGVSLLSAPGGTGSWVVNTAQLSQSCATSGFQDIACAYWTSAGAGYAFTVGDILTWVIRITTAGTLETDGLGHIKYEYVNANGAKVAGYLSEDIALQDCRNGACDQRLPDVPEPSTMVLLGSGLVAMAAGVRRRRG